jgi:ATP-binding cassette, subfamily B (MDR/TAP), member 1
VFTGARAACYTAITAINRRPLISAGGKGSADHVAVNSGKGSGVTDSSMPSDGGLILPGAKGSIEFRKVRFAYPTRQGIDVLSEFSLTVPAGKTVALVGPSGGGKSTVTNLLERFYDPVDGEILMDGVDLRKLDLMWLRQQIGLVSQEPKLFASSIRDNIGCVVAKISQGEIEDAARKANAHDFINQFPEKYDTQVGDLGGRLSGGQKQRIGKCYAYRWFIPLL